MPGADPRRWHKPLVSLILRRRWAALAKPPKCPLLYTTLYTYFEKVSVAYRKT
jgi:hypothetical protein